ncbi:uncharacterized protein LOC126378218 [Pectinophora gossypiella]|uniref:uncharacterized protein LOC126369736 n=1 Tax=Pectinophora gossypiella TaxID=13191 RepID=UPI00214F2410|nr:uncharacterized protein LOC126369736 [Pectinophora gossypiella]XP_049870881.1 uncharacterized protein LOC126370161 [Pectinophora gossypiella]XP_049879622.1 uncharacterized protein LOC126376332 [Pectinophora gossypiella]XP_049880421.1 uncharacterized protein LOC126376899 [Pectinophora gossypiella]XP_049880935.1 uncharacterized protein LOC126377255 [Pectinophora gossypiella]XP_049882398.1 uncharacterized protein LOC126378218 [Pectinophora gossypiella]
MSRRQQQLSSPEASVIINMSPEIPKYIIRLEILRAEETDSEVNVKLNSKAQYVVHNEHDNILYKALRLMYQMGAEVAARNESSGNIVQTHHQSYSPSDNR